MNDFFLLNNETLPHFFLDHQVEIKQIQVKNLNRFAQFADPFKTLENHSVEAITPLIEDQILNIMGLCSLVTTLKPNILIENLGQSTAITELIIKIIQVNEAYFKNEKAKTRKKDNSKKSSWFDSFQLLISTGHRTEEILEMSYGAFTEYLKAAQRYDSQRLKFNSIAIRAAQHANQIDFKKFVSGLDG